MSKVPESEIQAYGGDDPSIVAENPNKNWRSFIWDSFDKTPEERKFLFKLDAALLTISCLGYFIKYLDQANLFNAFVSGMKEDLSMNGNQLNYAITTWTVGYIISEIPSNMLLTKIRPSIWLPSLQIAWSVLTMLLARCNNVTQLYVLRFFIGLTEGGFYPAVNYILGSWYRKDELAKRAALFDIAGSAAGMFSGYLMAGLLSLNGRHGLKGWQWLYIMDGVISLPVAFAGFFIYPDFPSNTRVWYINEKDKEIATSRIEGRPQRKPYTKAKLLKIFKSWHVYLLPLVYLFCGAAAAGTAQPIFALFLKASQNPKYSVAEQNNYPTLTSAVSVISTLVYAWISDGFLGGRRWPLLIWAAIINFICFFSLALWNISNGWRWACYIISGQVVTIAPMSLSWGNEICSDDQEERAIVVAAMVDIVYVVGVWLVLVVWQQEQAPKYHSGFITASTFSVAAVIVTLVVWQLHKRDLRRKETEADEVIETEIASSEEKSEVPATAKGFAQV